MFTNEELVKIVRIIVTNGVQYNGKANIGAVLKTIGRDYPEFRVLMKKDKKEFSAQIKRLIDDWNSKTIDVFHSKLKELDPETYQKLTTKAETKEEKKSPTSLELPPLENAKNRKVVMRLAPYPSGALHIGNGRMVILNGYYSKRYNGKLILAFDDTIGSAEKIIDMESYDLIPEALDYLDVKIDETVYKSDRLNLFYDHAVQLFDKKKLYVCICDANEWRETNKLVELKLGKACSCRGRDKENNYELWEKMLEGTFNPGEAVVRMKTGMDQPDPALRDQIALRISDNIHPRVGDKYRVWPLLEFSWGIDDHLLGMTHIIRGIDLYKEGEIEKIIWDWFGWSHPEIIHHGRVKTEGFTFSKSKDAKNIRDGKYSGWDDPRTWSLQSLQRRGYLKEAVWNAVLSLGMGTGSVKISPKNFYHANRELIDNSAYRLFGLGEKLKIQISNIPSSIPKKIEVANHPTNVKLGNHLIPIGDIVEGKKILFIDKTDGPILKRSPYARLMHLFNVKIDKITKTQVSATYHGDNHEFIYENKYPIIQWLGEEHEKVPITLENGKKSKMFIEPEVKQFNQGTLFQIIRNAFYSIDQETPNLSLIFAHK
ncbi:MAG: glutamate--tRNA ligase [Candidatus Hodarchaeales archaeon]|jgi:glutamyl-tRNA synthetase